MFRCFHVFGRTIEDLQPYINRFCRVGDTVYSDGLPAHEHLRATFIHRVVNHSENFVDPEDSTNNINMIEGTHAALRKKSSVHGPI